MGQPFQTNSLLDAVKALLDADSVTNDITWRIGYESWDNLALPMGQITSSVDSLTTQYQAPVRTEGHQGLAITFRYAHANAETAERNRNDMFDAVLRVLRAAPFLGRDATGEVVSHEITAIRESANQAGVQPFSGAIIILDVTVQEV